MTEDKIWDAVSHGVVTCLQQHLSHELKRYATRRVVNIAAKDVIDGLNFDIISFDEEQKQLIIKVGFK